MRSSLTLGPTLLMASSMSSAVTRSGSNSTEADSVSRLTSQLSTASSASSAAVIFRTQDWQVMPATRTSHRSEIVLVRAVNEHSRSFTVESLITKPTVDLLIIGAFKKEKALVGAFSGHCENFAKAV